MKIGIMQPYFFPYIGYFQLIKSTDCWVVFDTPQYISKGWINRNRILHPDQLKEWQYITVPTQKHKLNEKINQVIINENIRWRERIMGQLTSYKKKAPYYSDVMDLIAEVLAYKTKKMSSFLINSLDQTCQFLGLNLNYTVLSEMELNIVNVEHPGQWALRISSSLRADEYINPPSGYTIFDHSEFIENDIKLSFLKPSLSTYVQRRGGFIPALSIIDVMMWNDVPAIQEMLNDYEILSQSELQEMENGA